MGTEQDPASTALEGAVTRFADLIEQVAGRHRLRDDHVDELVQEVRIRLWKRFADAEDISAIPASYVYRTATSAAIDLLRRRRARREPVSGPEELDGLPTLAAECSPENTFAEQELQRDLLRAVEGLGDARRAVVRMYLAGHSREEIARLLGWSDAKTRNLLYRGLHELRRRLHEMGIGAEEAR